MRPDALKAQEPTPEYLRDLVARSGFSQRALARKLGVNERTMRFWLAGQFPIPYTAQYALESYSDPLIAWIEKAFPYLESERNIPDSLFWELEELLKDR